MHLPARWASPHDVGLSALFDKWHLGPLRLLDFLALTVLAMHFGPWLKAHLPRVRFLETLGAASLPVFCAHLVLALLALALVGDPTSARPAWIDPALMVAMFGALYAVARTSLSLDHRAAQSRERAARLNRASPKSPSATAHSRRH